MALVTTYATLQTAIADWLNRSDLTAVIPNFIQNAEQRLKRDPRVRNPDIAVQAVATITFTGNVTAADSFKIGNQTYIFRASPSVANDVARGATLAISIANFVAAINGTGTAGTEYAAGTSVVQGVTATGSATVLTVTVNTPGSQGLNYHISEVVDGGSVATVVAFATGSGSSTIISLSASVTTNWLLTYHPDIYLYAALCESGPYLMDPELTQAWELELEKRISDLAGSVRTDPARTLDLTTYASLKRLIVDALKRGDLENVTPVLISLAEQNLQNDNRVRSLATVTYSITADDLAVPSGFHTLESWYHDTNPYFDEIQIVPADELGRHKQLYGESGVPKVAAILNGTFRFAPAPSDTFSTKMVYYQTITALSSGVNWLYTQQPQIYLYAALAEAGPWVMDDERAMGVVSLAKQKLEEAIAKMDADVWDNQWSGSLRRQFEPIG